MSNIHQVIFYPVGNGDTTQIILRMRKGVGNLFTFPMRSNADEQAIDMAAPEIPRNLHRPYYWVPTLHAGLGTLAQLLGLFIIWQAGTGLVPAALRFENYKLWMRTELVLWWMVILFGIVTYWVWL